MLFFFFLFHVSLLVSNLFSFLSVSFVLFLDFLFLCTMLHIAAHLFPHKARDKSISITWGGRPAEDEDQNNVSLKKQGELRWYGTMIIRRLDC